MAVLGTNDLGDGKVVVIIDHDPEVTATDAAKGSILIRTDTTPPRVYFKGADGSNTTVSEDALLFGTQFQEASSDGSSTTTSVDPTFVTKVTLTTPATLPAGNYLIVYCATGKNNTTNAMTAIRMRVDGVDEAFADLEIEVPTDEEAIFAGQKFIALTAGVHTIIIQFACQAAGPTAEILRARLVLWRVS